MPTSILMDKSKLNILFIVIFLSIKNTLPQQVLVAAMVTTQRGYIAKLIEQNGTVGSCCLRSLARAPALWRGLRTI